jgi:hypothetical protein
VFFVMTVAPRAAVGLAISRFPHRESLNPDSFASLKW